MFLSCFPLKRAPTKHAHAGFPGKQGGSPTSQTSPFSWCFSGPGKAVVSKTEREELAGVLTTFAEDEASKWVSLPSGPF